MINDNDGILIEMYLDGALEGEALVDFERRLEKEEELSEALAERRSFLQFLQNQPQREALKKTSEEVASKHFQPTATIRPMWRRTSFRIASLAAAIALLVFLWQPWETASLYDQFAQHKTLALAERGDPSIDPVAIEKAFAEKKYAAAIPLLKTYLLANPEATEAKLYLGICHLEQNQFQEGNAIFQQIYSGESIFKYEALWYLSLSAIKEKDKEKAVQYLSLIPAESNRYEQAQRLLKKLVN